MGRKRIRVCQEQRMMNDAGSIVIARGNAYDVEMWANTELIRLTPEQARELAGNLCRMADYADKKIAERIERKREADEAN